MFASTKYFFRVFLKERPKLVLSALLLFALAISWKISSRRNRSILSASSFLRYDDGGDIDRISELCKITNQIQQIREKENASYIDPAHQVVEELLEMVTYNQNICAEKRQEERLLMIIVNSARNHFVERQLIRKTWGSVEKYKEWRVRTVFLLGQSEYCLNLEKRDLEQEEILFTEEKSLLEEHEKYGDIVIGGFADSDRNVTYKHLMGYKFVLEYCPEADFIIKTIDDMFVDVPAILDARTMEFKGHGSGSTEKVYDIYCHEYHDTPTREALEEWREDTYPEYCLANDHGISMDWIKKIYSVRGEGGFFWIDDVFIMGKLREIAEKNYNETVKRFNMFANGKTIDLRNKENFVKENCEKKETEFGWFALLVRSSENFVVDMKCLWDRALRNANVTAILISNR